LTIYDKGFQVSQKQTGAKMAWNDENNKNPWGGNNQTPPELDEVIKDFKNKFNTRFGGGEIVKLLGKGSAFYAPAQSSVEMIESFIRDKKRVIPCASLCEGEFGIDGYFIGVPTVIGCNGVEKILTFELNSAEKNALDNTLTEVKKTVQETGL